MKYKCGLYIGRFQPIHIGHCSVIREMLNNCDEVIIVVGSATENRTKRNPLTFCERKTLIESCFPADLDRITIVPLADRASIANDASWGDYVFDNVRVVCGKTPDAVFEGVEDERKSWYENQNVAVYRVPRNFLPISGTELREAIAKGDSLLINMYFPYGARIHYGKVKEIIDETKN